ncbi:lytic transglycosylase domain-containing protein [Acidimangrovimonas sediminis]|uniref:lytic transglycosylase domain-containing protein n=1 Tax=Acidimangrovimonas sediminis TaxID=2056283 RepID=UPI000C7FA3CD|nr:lytic transglycosylase domain-containing protein [Acidimangrovimonas sediminis]
MPVRRLLIVLFLGLAAIGLAACGAPEPRGYARDVSGLHPNETPVLRRKINHYARVYDVPPSLIHKVIWRESRYDPNARNGQYWGLMQISARTARGMGYRGPDRGLLDPDTNLRYAVKYLRGAWVVSRGNEDRAVIWYARGYYYAAKRRGLLREAGLR